MGSFMQGSRWDFSGCNTGPACTPNLRGKKRAHDFMIGHDLFMWSPKGFLTGSANTPGSILVGTHFERDGRLLRHSKVSGHQRRSVPPRRLRNQRVGSVVFHCAANEHRREFAVVRCSISPRPYRKTSGLNTWQSWGGGSWTDGNLNWRYQF